MSPPGALARPWLDKYDVGVPAELQPDAPSIVAAFRSVVARDPAKVVIRYFDGLITAAELDALSDALACALEEDGFGKGDRIGIYLQNVPHFVIASLAAWKLGGTVVTVNPMYQARELHDVLSDSGARTLVCHADERLATTRRVAGESGVRRVLTCDALTYQTRDDARIFKTPTVSGDDAPDAFEAVLARHRGRTPRTRTVLSGEDVATLIYTSGTTGPAKGAIGTHAAMTQSVGVYRAWFPLSDTDVILAIAPLVHVTGLMAYLAPALSVGATLVLTYRFEATVFRDAVRETRATYTIGPTTVFIALLNSPEVSREDLSTLSKVYCGGAPLSAAIARRFEAKFGGRLLGIYGMTEATGAALIGPRGHPAPVDAPSGALAVGIPSSETTVQVLDEDRHALPPGELGEIAVSSPQIAAGYWNKEEETRSAFTEQGFLTGDIGFMDPQGWFYIVDRKKDQINVSGFKVWPREVEDVLNEHPAVSECAVVGVPHDYRGEDVCAFVVLKDGQPSEKDLRDFCGERLARYKVPGEVRLVSELPKTASGKILRRDLRELRSS